MAIKIFVDTSAFVALFDKKDQFYQKAKDYFMSLESGAVQLHTSNYIIDETITRIRIKNGHRLALEFGKYFFMSKIFQTHYIDLFSCKMSYCKAPFLFDRIESYEKQQRFLHSS